MDSAYWYDGFLLCELYYVTCVCEGKVSKEPRIEVGCFDYAVNLKNIFKILDSIKSMIASINSKNSEHKE